MADCIVPDCDKYALKTGFCGAHYARNRRHGSPTAGRVPNGEPLKFLLSAISMETDECIIWPYGLTSTGYALINLKNQKVRVSHFVLENTEGPAPSDDHLALHAPQICHNPKCVNKRHLRWGTRKDNQSDKWEDGTIRVGENHPMSKLTEAQVRAIRASNKPLSEIASKYSIHSETAGKIKRGKAWTHLQ